MKQIALLGCAVLAVFMLAGSAAAGDQIDTSNILVMGYYNSGTVINLSQAIQEFDFVTESTGQYVEGKLRVCYDDPDGRNSGNIQDFECRNGATTPILFATDVTVRVKSDGWIVAWLTNDQNLGTDLVFWGDANSNSLPSVTTLSKAIWRITDRSGLYYNKNEVKYYCYKYPTADRLLIGGRVTDKSGEAYSFLIPSATTVYEAYLSWSVWLADKYAKGKIKIDTTCIYSKDPSGKGLHEYARYSKNITDYSKDTRHMVYMESWHGSPANILKSAVAIIYKTG